MISGQDQSRRYVLLKLQACDYFMGLDESSKVWSALHEAVELLDFLDLHREFGQFHEIPQAPPGWMLEDRERALGMFREAREKMEHLINNPGRLDPAIKAFSKQAGAYLQFLGEIHAARFSTRKEMLPRVRVHFKTCESSMETGNDERGRKPFDVFLETLDALLEAAGEEMRSKHDISHQQLARLLPSLTFRDREALHERGVFRIRQHRRHRVFSHSKPLSDEAVHQVYQTLNLDKHLFSRDLGLNLLRTWGRFIPLEFNHMIIQFYNDPGYWGNPHMHPADIDLLRLGFAHYQYAMELGNNSDLTRMNYREALHCFKRSNIAPPKELRETLWAG